MIRISQIACVALALVACKSKPKATKGAGPGSGSGSALAKPPVPPPTGAAPGLTWTDTDGEVLVAIADGKLTGPCGLTGTVTPTEVTIGGDTQPWGKLVRDGRSYSMPRLDWVVSVGDTGLVTHKVGGTETQLGTVTGLAPDASEADLQWFGALVVAAPMIQHTLELASADSAYKLQLSGSADLRAWSVKSGTSVVALRGRADPRPVFRDLPAFDPAKVTVSSEAGKTYVVFVSRDDDATKAAFDADKYVVTEGADGALTIQAGTGKPRPFATVIGRAACRAHDQAIAALVWAYVGSMGGHTHAFPSTK